MVKERSLSTMVTAQVPVGVSLSTRYLPSCGQEFTSQRKADAKTGIHAIKRSSQESNVKLLYTNTGSFAFLLRLPMCTASLFHIRRTASVNGQGSLDCSAWWSHHPLRMPVATFDQRHHLQCSPCRQSSWAPQGKLLKKVTRT